MLEMMIRLVAERSEAVDNMMTKIILFVERVSRQAKELSMILTLLVILMEMVMVVEVNVMSIYDSFVEIRIFQADLGRQRRNLDLSRVETIDKTSILCLDYVTIR